MANNKTLTGNGIRGYYIEFYVNEDSTSIANNTSTISYSLKIKSGNYSYAQYGTGWSIYINGSRVSYMPDNGTDTSLSANSSLTLATGTTTVTHNNDGTKTVNISASVSMPEGSYGPGDMSCSGTWALTTIPRASSLSIPTLTIGSASTLTVTAASNTFTHQITYSFSGLTGTIATLNAGVSTTSWTPPNTFYAKLPNSTSGTVAITLKTYSGATEIGSNTYNATVNVGTSIKPTAPTVTLQPVNTNPWINSKGIYVGGYSAVKVTSSATAGTGASMSSYTISGAISGTGSPYTSGVLSAGAKSITVTATDSRGRTNSSTTSVTFLTYSYPGLTTFTADRGTYSGGSWTSNVNGDHIRITAVPSVSLSANGNTGTVTVKIGNTNPSATSGNYYYFTTTSATQSYSVTGSVTDSVGNTTSRGLTVPTIEVPLNINVDLPGIGVGMIAQTAHNFEIAPAWSLVADGRYNRMNYLPYSWNTSYSAGTAGYLRIATIQNYTWGTANSEPFHFRVYRTFDLAPVDLYLTLAFSSTSYDVAIQSLYYEAHGGLNNNTFSAFAIKTGTGSYDVYVQKPASGSVIDVFTYISQFTQDKCYITYTEAIATSVPAGAVMATPVPCLTPTVTITKTSGNSTASSVAFERSGNVCHLSFNISTTASISVGGNAFVGTTTAPKPIKAQTNASYYGSSVIITDFGASGTITVRINGASLASGATAYCNVIYLTNE